MPKIKIILGSTREGRFGVQIAQWFMEVANSQKGAQFELIDLKEVNLPFLDEPLPPSAGHYKHNTTKAWSKVIEDADGYVFITAEYNHGVPAPLKNAIDTVSREWAYKPVGFVGYGVVGGVRALEQLRQIVGQLKMYDLSEHVEIVNYWAYLDKTGNFVPNDKLVADAEKVISRVVFWAEIMTQARKKLPR